MRKYCYMLMVSLSICVFTSEAWGAFVGIEQARLAARNWLAKNASEPMNTKLGESIREIAHYSGEKYGDPGYYVVFLQPRGWILIPADDDHEAIIAFGDSYLTPQLYEKSVLANFFHVSSPSVEVGTRKCIDGEEHN